MLEEASASADPCEAAPGMSDSVSYLTEPAPVEPTGDDRWIQDGVRDDEANGSDIKHRGGVDLLDLWLGPASCGQW